MRDAFIDALTEAAASDERIWLVTGDLGFSVLEKFADRFPNRYLNAGVAEQNMVGVAAGLAMAGKRPFLYSIANFPVMRCFEQIRNDVAYHNLSVKIVAVGGGLNYASHGYTHHGVEDLAVLRVLPNMAVYAPGDPHEARAATRLLAEVPGPGYLRLGRAGEPPVHAGPLPADAVCKALILRDGADAAIVSTGGLLNMAMETASELARAGIQARVISMPCLTPVDADALLSAAATGVLVTLEEHREGGLAAAVAEVIATSGTATRFLPFYLRGPIIKVADNAAELRARSGLSVENVVSAILKQRAPAVS